MIMVCLISGSQGPGLAASCLVRLRAAAPVGITHYALLTHTHHSSGRVHAYIAYCPIQPITFVNVLLKMSTK